MKYLAHSARDGIPEQSYVAHVKNVKELSLQNAEAAAAYSKSDGQALVMCTAAAAQVHDL